MRHPTAMGTKRAEQTQPRRLRQRPPVLEGAGGDQLYLITRDAAIRTEALIGLLVASTPPRTQLDVLCAYGTAENGDRVSPTAMLSGFACRVLECGRAISEPTAAGGGPSPPADPGAHGAYAIGAPVRTPGGASGALCVGFTAGPPDRASTLWVVESYARLASLCLHDGDALDGLLAAGRLDALTGCLNHTAIRHELEREIGRSARHRRDLSCCFVDLDRFKQVNDVHGHPEGSRVLAEVAAILRAGVRSADTVGRYGGDEFIVVLPDTGSGSARALAERLRSLIRSANLTGGQEPLDASIGVAQWRAGTTSAELVLAADDALRAAKLAGGGKVVTEGDVVAGARHGVANAAR
jgi:diguanylate cyclase (GGDEF)-like protein